jgi:hypothetical protein
VPPVRPRRWRSGCRPPDLVAAPTAAAVDIDAESRTADRADPGALEPPGGQRRPAAPTRRPAPGRPRERCEAPRLALEVEPVEGVRYGGATHGSTSWRRAPTRRRSLKELPGTGLLT